MALLPSNPKQQRTLLIGLLPVLALFGYWYLMYGKTQDRISNLSSHLETLQSQNKVARAQMARGGPQLEQKVALYEQYMKRLEQLIPQRQEVPELLHAMTLQADQNNVTLQAMKPESEHAGPYYTRETYSLIARGPYHNIGKYLTAIGSLPRIVSPMKVGIETAKDVKQQKQQSGSTPKTEVEATFTIETYVLPSPAAPADTSKAKPGT